MPCCVVKQYLELMQYLAAGFQRLNGGHQGQPPERLSGRGHNGSFAVADVPAALLRGRASGAADANGWAVTFAKHAHCVRA